MRGRAEEIAPSFPGAIIQGWSGRALSPRSNFASMSIGPLVASVGCSACCSAVAGSGITDSAGGGDRELEMMRQAELARDFHVFQHVLERKMRLEVSFDHFRQLHRERF